MAVIIWLSVLIVRTVVLNSAYTSNRISDRKAKASLYSIIIKSQFSMSTPLSFILPTANTNHTWQKIWCLKSNVMFEHKLLILNLYKETKYCGLKHLQPVFSQLLVNILIILFSTSIEKCLQLCQEILSHAGHKHTSTAEAECCSLCLYCQVLTQKGLKVLTVFC